MGEFEYIAEHFPDVKEVVIEDDTFTARKERVLEICRLLKEKGLHKRLKWLCNARVNLDYDTMKAMKEAGCRLIIPGIESGSQEILNNIKKGTTIAQIETYMKSAKKAGLLVHACYMVGNRGETKETMDRPSSLHADWEVYGSVLSSASVPGNRGLCRAKSNNYIRGGYADYVKEDGTINCVLELPNISSQEMVEFCDRARKRYYFRPGYIMHRLWMGLRDPDDLKRSLKAFGSIKHYLFQK